MINIQTKTIPVNPQLLDMTYQCIDVHCDQFVVSDQTQPPKCPIHHQYMEPLNESEVAQ